MHRSKTCFKCSRFLPLEQFYKHKMMGDGHLNKCIDCAKKDEHARRLSKIDEIRAYDRARAKTKERRKQAAEILKRWRASDSRIAAAHRAVARAIKSGNLIKLPCEVCAENKSEAHHDDYNKPLDVKWYCSVHHKARHKFLAINGIDPYNMPIQEEKP